MAYIPPNAIWYIADVIIEITVQGDSRNVVHVNTLLVRADAPEEAYVKAIALGQAQVGEPYLNGEGQTVTAKFIGLRDLNVVHDVLEHGAELFFEELISVGATDLSGMVHQKEQLSVFCEIASRVDFPDYGSGEIERNFELTRHKASIDS